MRSEPALSGLPGRRGWFACAVSQGAIVAAELGLTAGSVHLAPYSSRWSLEFESERVTLAGELRSLVVRIEHVGSTAVPGLCAKPIVDIAVAIHDAAAAQPVAAGLERLSYRFAVDAGDEGGLIYFKESARSIRTHHVHVVAIDDPQWANYLGFRDRLRNDGRLRAQYAVLKRELACLYPSDRDAYTAAKTKFVRDALAK